MYQDPEVLAVIAKKSIKRFREQNFRVYYKNGKTHLYFYHSITNVCKFHFISHKITPIKIFQLKYVTKGIPYNYKIIRLYGKGLNVTRYSKHVTIDHLIKFQKRYRTIKHGNSNLNE